MRRRHAAVVSCLSTLSLAACASQGARPAGSVTPQQQFEKLKSLAGTWRSVPGSPMQGTMRYTVIGGGSTVQEDIFPGTDHAMVTMYHLDGDRLVMTHYCAAGNQPSCRAAAANDLSEIRWEFVSLSNGDAKKDMHMHEGVTRFVEDGRIRSEWQSWQDGKPGEFRAVLDLERAP